MKGKTRLFIIFCIAALLLYWRRLLPDGKEAVEIDLDTERAAQLAARLRTAEAAEVAGKGQDDIDMEALLEKIESEKGAEP